MMDQILMQFCDQKHNAWPYIVKQDQVKTKTKTSTRKRQDQEQDKAWHDCQIR